MPQATRSDYKQQLTRHIPKDQVPRRLQVLKKRKNSVPRQQKSVRPTLQLLPSQRQTSTTAKRRQAYRNYTSHHPSKATLHSHRQNHPQQPTQPEYLTMHTSHSKSPHNNHQVQNQNTSPQLRQQANTTNTNLQYYAQNPHPRHQSNATPSRTRPPNLPMQAVPKHTSTNSYYQANRRIRPSPQGKQSSQQNTLSRTKPS